MIQLIVTRNLAPQCGNLIPRFRRRQIRRQGADRQSETDEQGQQFHGRYDLR
jgi:hypothetical protein